MTRYGETDTDIAEAKKTYEDFISDEQARDAEFRHRIYLMDRAQEQSDLGFAKTIDRLHRVADRKHGAAVARLPPGGQPGDEFVLADRGILELVDQQMPDAIVERKREIGWSIHAAESEQRTLRNLGEVDLPAGLKHQFQLRDRARQQPRDRAEDFPLAFAVGRRRQAADFVQCVAQSVVTGKSCRQRERAFLPAFCRFFLGLVATRRKAFIDRVALAPIADFARSRP